MDGDNAIQALAEAIDSRTLADSNVLTLAAAGFTAGAGFTGLAGQVRKRGGFVGLQVTALTTSNALAEGDLGNLNCVNIPVGWQPLLGSPVTPGSVGPVVSAHAYAGFITITATATAVPAGGGLSFVALWMTANT